MIASSRLVLFELESVAESPEGIVKTINTLEFLIRQVQNVVQEFVFLIIFQVMSTLLIRGSHFEDHCYHPSLESLPALNHWPKTIVTPYISATFYILKKFTASNSTSLFIQHSCHLPGYSISPTP